MDSSIVNVLAERYKDKILRVTPSLMEALGMEKRGTRLDVDEFQLSCIPFDISLSAANLLAFLSPREIAFFEGIAKAKPQKLNMVFKIPESSKPIAFFVRIEIVSFRKPAQDSPYCFIGVKFKEPPFALKEIVVSYLKGIEDAQAYYDEAEDLALDEKAILSCLGSLRLNCLKDGLIAERLRVLSMSPKKVRLFGDFEGELPAEGEELDLEPDGVEASGTLKLKVVALPAFPDAPGFFWLEGELLFNPWLYRNMRKVLPLQKKTAKGGG